MLILALAAWWLSPQLESGQIRYQEEPLAKEPLRLKPGEYYQYLYAGNASGILFNSTLTYSVIGFGNCTGLLLEEAENRTPICLDRYGNDAGGNNVSLSPPVFYVFRPWMLAVADGWRWNVSGYLDFPGQRLDILDARFTTIGKEPFLGREAYRVQARYLSSNLTQEVTYWVDARKRILLKEESEGYSIELIASSFADDH